MEQRTTLKDWLVARAERDPSWVREQLLREAERLEYLISETIKKLHFPPEEGWSVYTDRGRLAAQALDTFFRVIDQLLAGASPKKIEFPAWMFSEQLPLPEPAEPPAEAPADMVEEERPWEALGISQEMYERELLEIVGSSVAIRNAVGRALHAGPHVPAGPALRLLVKVGWEPGAIRNVGKRGITFLRQKFAEAGYPVD